MPAPTFVQEDEVANWDLATTPRNLPAFSPAAGNLLLAFMTASNTDGDAADLSISGGPTWSNVRDQPGTFQLDCCTRVLSATAAGGSITPSISATITQGPPEFGANVLEFSGHAGIGATAGTTNGVTGTHPTLAITTQADNSAIAVIFGEFNAVAVPTSYDTINGFTPTVANGSVKTEIQLAAHYTISVLYYPDAGAAGSKTVGATYPAAADAMIIAVEIKGLASAAGLAPDTFLPDATLLDLADDTGDPALGFLYRAPDYSPLVLPGFPLPNMGRVLRPNYRMIRRSEMAAPIFAQAIAPTVPPYIQDPGRRELRAQPLRRSRIAMAPPVQLAPPVQFGRARRYWFGRRRAQITPTPAQDSPAARPARSRRWIGRGRPGAPMPVPLQVTPPAAPIYPLQLVRVVRRGWLRGRPDMPTPVPPQVTPPAAPTYPLAPVRVARRGLLRRRSGAPAPIPAQSVPPAQAVKIPRRGWLRRRSGVPMPVPAQVTPPPAPTYPLSPVRVARRGWLRRRSGVPAPAPTQTVPLPQPVRVARRGLLRRRARILTPVPPQIVIAPPVYPRQPVRRRIIALLLRRPGRLRFPTQPGAVISPPAGPPGNIGDLRSDFPGDAGPIDESVIGGSTQSGRASDGSVRHTDDRSIPGNIE